MNKEKIEHLRTRIASHFRQRYEFDRVTVSLTLGCAILTAICYWLMNVMANVASIRSPDNRVVAPLPDAGFEKIGKIAALYLTDLFDAIAILPAVIFLLCVHRTPLACAVQTLIACSIGCILRITTVAITSFPDPRLDCERVTGSPFHSVSLHRCGDAMYSGHTMLFVLGALIWTSFSPLTWLYRAITVFFWGCAVGGGVIIIANRSHYTVDVLVACYVMVGAWYFVQWWWHQWVVVPNRLVTLRFPHGHLYDQRGCKLTTVAAASHHHHSTMTSADLTYRHQQHTHDTNSATEHSLPMTMQDVTVPPLNGQGNFSSAPAIPSPSASRPEVTIHQAA
ncbi:PAP2 superfamily C-terminal-domain-containing protein [Syncephalis pseudoplumigaleata]|uniref:PAP2 superfamily C-terminal-domain-containing protein n=1 Tax=Syncephalis pseudoplumigaleata TaxID=1712513 RepID=A0A4P9YV29_9FUNG|nr:PAP2 superfamily C-terminal-domain-containing protein [Syncephalis pseudoplumigaleata]|eukprot:RKP23903.1 PAP2 superfamily C-terminal-domain-containing protein [Syncephalis pseudoplumigaleata]